MEWAAPVARSRTASARLRAEPMTASASSSAMPFASSTFAPASSPRRRVSVAMSSRIWVTCASMSSGVAADCRVVAMVPLRVPVRLVAQSVG
jgi:hypothetical protein